jgi:hypothetical protein
MRRLALLSFLTLALVTFAAPAFAGAGLHLGMTVNPDDFLLGLHFESAAVAPSVTLVPSAEVGFGDATMIAGNLDLHYTFKTQSELAPYAGGGITLNWFDNDGGSETDFGGSILAGIKLSPKYFLEGKVGLGDVPDWKFYVGAHVK